MNHHKLYHIPLMLLVECKAGRCCGIHFVGIVFVFHLMMSSVSNQYDETTQQPLESCSNHGEVDFIFQVGAVGHEFDSLSGILVFNKYARDVCCLVRVYSQKEKEKGYR